MIDILTNKKKCVPIKPVIKGHHLNYMFCDLITMPRYRRNFCSQQSTANSLDYERNKLVCLVIKYNAFGNLLQKKRSVSPPPHFFLMGVYKRLVFCQKLPQKLQFSASKLGGGRLLEHGHLLEILRCVSWIQKKR